MSIFFFIENFYDKNAIKCFKNKEFIRYVYSDDYVIPNNCIVNKKLVPYFKS